MIQMNPIFKPDESEASETPIEKAKRIKCDSKCDSKCAFVHMTVMILGILGLITLISYASYPTF